jgi:carbamoyltransferase
VDIREDGSILLNMDYFSYATGLRMVFEDKWEQLFGVPRRRGGIGDFAGLHGYGPRNQQVTEEIVMRLCQAAIELTEKQISGIGGRGGTQLCGQRQSSALRYV